jgi:purine nucleosidase
VPRKVIIDCDPGQDDAVALFLAMASPEDFEILGITAVAGNVPLELTQRNARMMCDIANRRDILVYAGCERPMVVEPVTAEYVHGNTGIDGIDVFEPETPLQEQHAVDFIIATLLTQKVPVTLISTGPMTNLGTAIRREPAILDRVEAVASMGGAMREGGNRSPSAEFNVLADPHAAEIVYDCGRPVTAFGLDVTHQVLSTRERVARIREIGNRVATATAGMLGFFHRHDTKKYGSEGSPLHDPCPVAWLLRPELFRTRRCNLSVEKESTLTLGHTAVDFWHVTDRLPNVDWAFEVDADGFYDLLVERIARF